jgi:hypothetical protein
MPRSSVERELRLLRMHRRPQLVCSTRIEEVGLTLTCSYDPENDALLFDFGLDEPSFELPEGDGRMVWRIGRQTGSVAGFTILEAKRFGVSEVRVDIDARKQDIERGIRSVPTALASTRPSRVLIESVVVMAQERQEPVASHAPLIGPAFNEALEEFQRRFVKPESLASVSSPP